jgi:peptidoglycan hydrolase FlgJ
MVPRLLPEFASLSGAEVTHSLPPSRIVAENLTDQEPFMDVPTLAPAALTGPPSPVSRRDALMSKAEELEATFLSEMLAHSGLGKTQDSFGGGHGEEQFASFLRQEQARIITQNGGLGLAELIFNSLLEAENGTA